MSEQVVADGHRLRALQMGVTRHHPARMCARLGSKGFDHVGQRRDQLRRGNPAVEPKVQGNLIVARTPCVKGRASRCDLCETSLDGGMDVLIGLAELELTTVELALDSAKAALDRRQPSPGQEARPGEAARMGDAAGDVERIQLEIRFQR